MMNSTAVTRRDLAEKGVDALDRDKTSAIKVSRIAGGVSFASALEVMEFSKMMSVAGQAVPPHLRTNPGMCLAVTFQAVEWGMSPFSVAQKSYVVNDRIAYESQLLHAVIEARAPMSQRLDCEYKGEGPDRQCTIIGRFEDSTVRTYTTPKVKDIRVKNSPLWQADVDQQLFYYGSRAWARKWCPDVLLGIYTREDLIEHPTIGRDPEDNPQGLHARLSGAKEGGEGFGGHERVHSELDNIAGGGGQIIDGEAIRGGDQAPAEAAKPGKGGAKGGKAAKGGGKGKPAPAAEAKAAPEPEQAPAKAEKPAAPAKPPKNAKEWAAYAKGWIEAEASAVEIGQRWTRERKLRNDIGVTADDREPVEKVMRERVAELEKEPQQ